MEFHNLRAELYMHTTHIYAFPKCKSLMGIKTNTHTKRERERERERERRTKSKSKYSSNDHESIRDVYCPRS